ncbi:MAG: ABC transporter ATP-binding protein [Corynebacterium sp.]|nr:ABC transporter ATP-binding protein [Corynebacterium sp.]
MNPTLEIRDLTITKGEQVLVDGISLDIAPGKKLGLIGESGAGKSLTALAIMGLLPQNLSLSGSIIFNGQELIGRSQKDYASLRGRHIAMIFQEPLTALNPVMKVGKQLLRAIHLHRAQTGMDPKARAQEMWENVGLDAELFDRYPHELSGGQRQRVMIAMALSNKPELLLCDEATTALDAFLARGIVDLIRELAAKEGTSVLFISHDLAISSYFADEVAIINKGKIEEISIAKPQLEIASDYGRKLIATSDMEARDNQGKLYTMETVNSVDFPYIPGHRYREPAQIPIGAPLVEITNLGKKYKKSWRRPETTAVENINLTIRRGERLGIIGGSGSGKSTILQMIAGIEKPTSGNITWHTKSKPRISMIFQDPYSSLDPRRTVGESIAEGLGHRDNTVIKKALEDVGIESSAASRYPHEFSGGQRQRISIARALVSKPDIILADEAVSALDVSIRAQVINLLNEILATKTCEFPTSLVFVSHDLDLISTISDNVAILNIGQVVEFGLVREVFNHPKSSFTQALLDSSLPKPGVKLP